MKPQSNGSRLPRIAARALPLAEAPRIGVAMQGHEQLIRPRPRAAGRAVFALDKHRRDGCRQRRGRLERAQDRVCGRFGLAIESHRLTFRLLQDQGWTRPRVELLFPRGHFHAPTEHRSAESNGMPPSACVNKRCRRSIGHIPAETTLKRGRNSSEGAAQERARSFGSSGIDVGETPPRRPSPAFAFVVCSSRAKFDAPADKCRRGRWWRFNHTTIV